MTIGAVAKAAGVATSAIRYYEAAGILPPPARTNGIRRYTSDVVTKLQVIRFCREAGMPVRSLKWMGGSLEEGSSRRDEWLRVVRERIAAVGASIREAKQTRAMLTRAADCRCDEPGRECVVLNETRVRHPRRTRREHR